MTMTITESAADIGEMMSTISPVPKMSTAEYNLTGGYGLVRLEAIFNAIKDPSDWKAPISVWVSGELVNVAVEAIKFYTATVPTVGLDSLRMQYLIESIGYRAGPAGDD